MPGWSHMEGSEWPWFTRLLATLGFGKRLAYLELLAEIEGEYRELYAINKRRLRDQLWRNGGHEWLEEQVIRYREIEDNDWHTLDTVDL